MNLTKFAADLQERFTALDMAISIHYRGSMFIPKAHDICIKASELLKARVDIGTLETVLTYHPKAYQIVHSGPSSPYYGICLPMGIRPVMFHALLKSRREVFRSIAMKSSSRLPVKLSDIAVSYKNLPQTLSEMAPVESPGSLKKPDIGVFLRKNESRTPASLKRYGGVSKSDVSNSSPQFTLKKSKPTNGLSLIERIKAKEKKRSLNFISNEELKSDLHALHIKSKLPKVYDILYEMNVWGNRVPNSFKTFPLTKVISVIQDSFENAISEEQIEEILEQLASLLPAKVKKIEISGIHVVKVYQLSRDLDISTLKDSKPSDTCL
ncbi:hypothetical protein OXX80_012016 [Metschnikowia pulcherrima]